MNGNFYSIPNPWGSDEDESTRQTIENLSDIILKYRKYGTSNRTIVETSPRLKDFPDPTTGEISKSYRPDFDFDKDGIWQNVGIGMRARRISNYLKAFVASSWEETLSLFLKGGYYEINLPESIKLRIKILLNAWIPNDIFMEFILPECTIEELQSFFPKVPINILEILLKHGIRREFHFTFSYNPKDLKSYIDTIRAVSKNQIISESAKLEQIKLLLQNLSLEQIIPNGQTWNSRQIYTLPSEEYIPALDEISRIKPQFAKRLEKSHKINITVPAEDFNDVVGWIETIWNESHTLSRYEDIPRNENINLGIEIPYRVYLRMMNLLFEVDRELYELIISKNLYVHGVNKENRKLLKVIDLTKSERALNNLFEIIQRITEA